MWAQSVSPINSQEAPSQVVGQHREALPASCAPHPDHLSPFLGSSPLLHSRACPPPNSSNRKLRGDTPAGWNSVATGSWCDDCVTAQTGLHVPGSLPSLPEYGVPASFTWLRMSRKMEYPMHACKLTGAPFPTPQSALCCPAPFCSALLRIVKSPPSGCGA